MREGLERFDVRGLSLAVHTFGEPGRPTILMLHGFMDQGRSFRPVAEALADQYYVVAPDFRGHGRSGWVGAGGYYYFHDYYADLSRLVFVLGLERFSVLGHSMGGSAAIGLANLVPDRVESLVIMEGFGPPSEPLELAPDRLRRFAEALSAPTVLGDVGERRAARRPLASVSEAAERMRGLNPRLSLGRALELATDGTELAEAGEGVVWRFDPLHRTPSARPYNLEEFKHFLRGLSMPVLGLYGAESSFPFGDLAERHRALPSLRVGVVPNAAHNIHHDRPELVALAARFWFSDARSGSLPEPLIETTLDVPELGG